MNNRGPVSQSVLALVNAVSGFGLVHVLGAANRRMRLHLGWWVCTRELRTRGARHRLRMTNAHSSEERLTGQVDAGALALAGIENARFAIASRDAIAAANDLAQAQLYSQRLANEPSDIIPAGVGEGDSSGPSDAAGPHGLLSPFGAQTGMLSAQADLLNGNLKGADDELRAIESDVPPQSDSERSAPSLRTPKPGLSCHRGLLRRSVRCADTTHGRSICTDLLQRPRRRNASERSRDGHRSDRGSAWFAGGVRALPARHSVGRGGQMGLEVTGAFVDAGRHCAEVRSSIESGFKNTH